MEATSEHEAEYDIKFPEIIANYCYPYLLISLTLLTLIVRYF